MGSDVEVRAQFAAALAKLWRDDMGGEIDDIPAEAWDEVLSGYLDALLPVATQLLADERAKVRATFLALPEQLRKEGRDSGEDPYRAGLDRAAELIEEVAEAET